MSRVQKGGLILVALVLVGLSLHELRHLRQYGHFAPFGLHADVFITISDDVLGVEGIAKIYHAKVTNYGLFPSTISVCELRVSGAPAVQVNYAVERWDSRSKEWMLVPEWDFDGYRLFCRPEFEVTESILRD